MLLSLATAGALGACSDDDGNGNAGGGTLQVNIAGLPAGVDADVTVTGPGGYTNTLEATATLADLATGSYTVTAASVSSGATSYAGAVTGSPASVSDGETTTVQVSYAVPAGLDLALEPVVTGLAFPLVLTAPAGDARLFIVEKNGRIRIVKNGSLLPTPFLDITSLTSKGGEQGLLGLAFDPQYASNGRFFVSYTDGGGGNVLASYQVSSGNPDVANPASAAIRLQVAQPFANHNGGHIAFGPDGFLYLGIGDGGSGGDPQGNGQDPTDLLGSTLRLDVRGATGYEVPSSNPFVGIAGRRAELWDLGLRNPWRFSFDRATGDLYIADVGQNELEEVNVATAASGGGRGRNYGWAITEGGACFGSGGCDRTGLTEPVLDYSHAEGCSVTGGYVYRGSAIAGLAGTYFYSDYCGGWVRSFRAVGGVATEQREWAGLDTGAQVVSFGEDAAGELYVLTSAGSVSRIVTR
ncbi:MAG: PQQ-dependent sugar dehydrogenase [Gemmatimonadales bacterium]|nr:PQQ-dependent sugar dehydrogenase [Gemmatimonadales bacterium]